ncbi:MAG: amidohydrolase family protein [Bryobacteraceae bacterium]|nr:amidohydrolase family protein [Bryobacteraceae bacterium]
MRLTLGLLAAMFALSAETKFLRNATVFDGTGRAARKGVSIVVTDGRITAIGSGVSAPKGAETIDLTGKFVIPGIINSHGHLGNTKGFIQDPKNFTRENAEAQLKLYASYGVTTMVSMGSDQPPVWAIRKEQREGRPAMCRIVTAGRGFTGKNGYPTSAMGMKGVPYEIETVEQANKAVDEQAAMKADLIKIWMDDHLGKEKKIAPELAKAIIARAHQHGIKVAAHIFYREDARTLIDGGLDMIVHSVRDKPVDAELIALMKKKGAWQGAGTLTREISMFWYAEPRPFLDDPFFTRGVGGPNGEIVTRMKSEAYQKGQRIDPDHALYPGFLATAQKNLKALYDAGVNVGFGTDSGPPVRFQGYFEHWEMELMRDASFKPAEILTIATRNSARNLGLEKDLGTLEKGKWADLVVLDKDPLEDVRNTRTIAMTMIAGNVAYKAN